jgi:hypothetical protein
VPGAGGVVVRLRGVGVAVNFDREHRGAAGEVDDVGGEDRLVAELVVLEAVGAKVVPEAGFGGRRVGPHFFGSADQFWVAHLELPLSPTLSPEGERETVSAPSLRLRGEGWGEGRAP